MWWKKKKKKINLSKGIKGKYFDIYTFLGVFVMHYGIKN